MSAAPTIQEPARARVHWWNPWHWTGATWALVIGLSVLAAPCISRAILLSTVPSIPEPFDVEEFCKWDVPADEDAMPEYLQAAELTKDLTFPNSIWRDFGKICHDGWNPNDNSALQNLELFREAMPIWLRASQKKHARILAVPAGHDRYQLERSMKRFYVIAGVEASRLIHAGDLDGAWNWIRALFRGGGHFTQRGDVSQWAYGYAVHATSMTIAARWAEEPSLTSEQLKAALADLRTDFELYEPTSNMLKAQYLEDRSTLRKPDWVTYIYDPLPESVPDPARKIAYWAIGEPELSERILRQILANQIREIDKPLTSRHAFTGTGRVLVYDTGTAGPANSGQLAPQQIDRALNRSVMLRDWDIMSPVVERLRLWLARQTVIETVLATQAYRRDHGVFPVSLSQLVPDYLPSIPVDPSDPGGKAVCYRRDSESKAVVWIRWHDAIDDGGDVVSRPSEGETAGHVASDFGFELK